MIEVEIKLPVKELHSVEKKLALLGFVSGCRFREVDMYFDNENRQIRKQGEALRVRKVTELQTGKSNTVITFKGRKLDQISMSRKELETGVEDAETCIQIFQSLGFQTVLPVVVKTRQHYESGKMTACLDSVEGLGDFLELEMVIREDESKELALSQIEEVLKQLGYTLADTTKTSYLSMLQHVED